MRAIYRYAVGFGASISLPGSAFNPANTTLGVFYCAKVNGVDLIYATGGSGGVVKVQYCLELDPKYYQNGAPVWIDHPYLGDVEPVPKVGNIAFPVAGLRLNITTLPALPAGGGFALVMLSAGQMGTG